MVAPNAAAAVDVAESSFQSCRADFFHTPKNWEFFDYLPKNKEFFGLVPKSLFWGLKPRMNIADELIR